MKKIVLVLAVCILLLCGCSSISTVEKEKVDDVPQSMFVLIEQSYSWKIVYHKDTKVMYAVSDGSYNHGTFTILLNADGTPMLYKGGAE